MKTLHPNLAARAYRDYRAVWAAAIAIGFVTAALLGYNVQTAYRYFATTQETRAEIAELEEQVALERERTRAAEREALQFDAPRLRAESQYVNARIAERAFSWSALLDDLEEVYPADVRITRLTPRTADGTSTLTIDSFAKNQDGMVALLNHMLANPKFSAPFPNSETATEDGQYRFSISAGYRPTPLGVRK